MALAATALVAVPCATGTAAAAPAPAPTCTAADALFEAGDLRGARTAYEALPQSVPCASAGVAAVKDVQALCARGQAYVGAHQNGDARKAFQSALEKNPRAKCAKKGLRQVGQSWMTRVLDAVIGSLDQVLVALGLLLAALFLFLLLGYVESLRPYLLRLPGVGRLLGPRLSFALDDKVAGETLAAPMTARIRETLQSFRQRALDDSPLGDYDMDVIPAGEQFAIAVTGTSALKESLNKAREVSEHTKVVGAVLDLLYAALPIERFTMAGVLDPPSIGVASATLTLEADARLEAAIKLQGTVRAQPTDADYLALSGPAAVWVQYEVVRVQRPEEVEPNAGKSNAILRLALDRRLAGDEEGARAGLEDAVAANAQNWAAHVLLAITLAGSAGSDYRLAIQILEDALAEMKGTGGVAAYRDDPNYWRLSYQLAAQRLNSFVASGGTGAGENRDAQLAETGARRLVDEAGEAIARCEQELEDAGARKEDLSTRRLLRFMQRTVKPCAEIVLAATEVRGEARAAAADKRVADVRASGINVPLSYRVHYNFACYEADRAGPKPGGGERPPAQEERAERALDDLRAALRKSHGPARTELIARAGTDPSLAPVREDPGHRDRFARLLGLYGLSAGGVR